MAGAEVGGGAEVAEGGEGGDEGAGCVGLGEVGLGVGEAGVAHCFAEGGVFDEGGEVGGEGLGIALVAEEAGLVFEDHFGDAGEAGGDAGEAGGHGLHEDGGEVVFAAVGFGGAGEGEDLGFFGEEANDLVHAEGAGEVDEVLEMEVSDLAAEGVFEGAFTDDAAVEGDLLIAEDGAGGDEVGVAFFLDEAADAEDAAGGAGAVGVGAGVDEGLEVEAVVDAVDAGGDGGVLGAELVGGEVADGGDEGRVEEEAIEVGALGFGGAEDVVGVGGEAGAQAGELAEPPAGAGANACEVGVDVAGGVGAEGGEVFGDPGGFVNAGFVRLIGPMAEGDADAAGEGVGVFPGADLGGEVVGWGEEVDAVEEFSREVTDVFVTGVANGVDEGADALALEFEDLADAEGLRERGEPFEDVGDVPGGLGTHEDPASLRVERGEGKCSTPCITFSGDTGCRSTCSGSCRCRGRWRRWRRGRRGRGCGWRWRVCGSVFRGGWCRGRGCRRGGGC